MYNKVIFIKKSILQTYVTRIHVLKTEKATTNYAGKMQQKYQNKGYKKHEYMQGIGLHFMTIFVNVNERWKVFQANTYTLVMGPSRAGSSHSSSWRIFSSARDLFHFSSKLKIGQKRAEIHFYNKLVLKMTKLCT